MLEYLARAILLIATGLLGLATSVLIWGWVFWGMIIGRSIAWRINRNWNDNRVGVFSFWFMVAGAVLLWLLWRYALPDWWIAATPLLASD